MPEHGGEPVTLLVTAPRAALGRRPDEPDRLDDTTDPAADQNARFDDGTPLSPESARRLGCDAWLVAAIVGTGPEVLDIGRMARTVPRGIRRALVARDGGCAFPGCGRPARWCHADHIWHWEDGGPTALWNLVLLCGHHHRVIHHHGWSVWIVDDTGRPVFRPPRWTDPGQTPRPAWRPPTLPEHLPLLT